MTTFYLVRHGETTGGEGDPGLAPSGVAQARAAAAKLAAAPVTHVFSSPLQRARETAAVIGDAVRLPVEVDERLRERANWGDVPGLSWDEFVAHWERSTRDRDYVVPGGFSARQAGRRAAAFVHEIAPRVPDGHVVAVAHGGIIVDLLLEFFDEDELLTRDPQLHHMPWCSITDLVVNSEGARIGCLAHWPDGARA